MLSPAAVLGPSGSLAELRASWDSFQEDVRCAWRKVHAVESTVGRLLKLAEESWANIESERRKLEEEKAELAHERGRLLQLRAELESSTADRGSSTLHRSDPVTPCSNDLIGLNLGGQERLTVKRSLLLQVEGSMLSSMFSGRYEERLDRDKDGNVFLDYSPSVMMPLIKFLRTLRDAPPETPPQRPKVAPEDREAWANMINFFGVSPLMSASTFRGIRQDVRIDELTGWTMYFCKPYSHKSCLDDFKPPAHLGGGAEGTALLVAARRRGEETLALAAMGRASVVTHLRADASTRLHNGAYWYCQEGKAVGFGPSGVIRLSHAASDLNHPDDPLRLGWPISRCGGGRAGAARDLDSSVEWEKVLFVGHADIMD